MYVLESMVSCLHSHYENIFRNLMHPNLPKFEMQGKNAHVVKIS